MISMTVISMHDVSSFCPEDMRSVLGRALPTSSGYTGHSHVSGVQSQVQRMEG